MKIIGKLFSFLIGILYFINAAIGSLLVLPCRAITALCCLAGVVLMISGGFINWKEYVPCFGIGIVFSLVPVIMVSGFGKVLLWVDETCCRK